MKKIIVLLLAVGMLSAASAQFKGHGHYYPHYPRTRVIISGGLYPYYGYPLGYGYPFGFGYPFDYGYRHDVFRPSKLDVEIETIRHDYDQRIASVKMDKSLTGKERRQEKRRLRKERDNAIDAAKENYYKQN